MDKKFAQQLKGFNLNEILIANKFLMDETIKAKDSPSNTFTPLPHCVSYYNGIILIAYYIES